MMAGIVWISKKKKKNQDNVKLLTLLALLVFDSPMHEASSAEVCQSSIVAAERDQDLGNETFWASPFHLYFP